MSDKQHHPDQEEVEHTGDRRPGTSGGGMTGATGNLTSDAFGTEPFVPGELREIEDPTRAGRLTEALARHAGHEGEGTGMEPLPPAEAGGSGAAQGSGGYGSSHGLAADDPAYRLDEEPDPTSRASGPLRDDTDSYAEGEEHL